MGRSAVRRRGLDFDEAFLALCFFRVGFIVGGHTATPCIGEQLGGRKSGPAKTWEARFAVVSSRPPQNSRESPAYGQRFADGALRPVLKSGGVAYPVVGMVGIIDPSTLACLVSDMVLGFVKRYPLGERCIVRVLLALDRGGGGRLQTSMFPGVRPPLASGETIKTGVVGLGDTNISEQPQSWARFLR